MSSYDSNYAANMPESRDDHEPTPQEPEIPVELWMLWSDLHREFIEPGLESGMLVFTSEQDALDEMTEQENENGLSVRPVRVK